jgi:hypothetical protein
VKIRTYAIGAGLVILAVAGHHAEITDQYPTAHSSGGGLLKPGTVPAAYAAIIAEAGTTCPQITPALLAAQIDQESGFDPDAVSGTGAQGIAQFEPATAASHHVDPWNPDSAIHGMAALDCSYVHRYGSVTLALAAYNGGPGILGHWRQVGQTRAYVADILAAAARYTDTTTPTTTPKPAPSHPATSAAATAENLLEQLLDALRTAASGGRP